MSGAVNHSKVGLYDFFFANKKRKTYTNLGVSLLLIVVLLVFAIRPTILTISEIRERTQEYRELNKKAEEKINAAKTLSTQLNSSSVDSPEGLKGEIEFMEKVFFKSPNIKTFYKNMYQRAQDNKIAIRSVSPKYIGQNTTTTQQTYENSGSAPSVTYYEINVIVEGDNLRNMENFVKTVEGSKDFPVISRLRSININNLIEENKVRVPDANSQASNTITGSFLFVIYIDPTAPIDSMEGL